MRFLFFCLIFLNTPVIFGEINEPVEIDPSHRAFLADNCVSCHNSKKTKGKFNLDKDGLSLSISDIKTADSWQKVLAAINAREMPPEDEPQPGEDEKAVFLEMLSDKIVQARRALSDAGRITVMRRLNQREYKNTLEDLLGIPVDASHMPSDEDGEQFNTDGSSLFISAGQLKDYLDTARSALKMSLGAYTDKPSNIYKEENLAQRSKAGIQKEHDNVLEKYGRYLKYKDDPNPDKNPNDYGFNNERDAKAQKIVYDRDFNALSVYLSHPLADHGKLLGSYRNYKRTSLNFKPSKHPVGYYRVKAKMARLENAPAHMTFINLGFLDQGEVSRLETFHIHQLPDNPQEIETRVFYDGKSSHLSFQIKPTHFKQQDPLVTLMVQEMEFEGPLKVEPPDLVRSILETFKAEPDEKQLRDLLESLALQIFRHDHPQKEYLDGLYRIYTKKIKEGLEPLQAFIEPVAMMFSSPGFLYLSEEAQEKKSKHLSQRELAIRLAYFLWDGPPDQHLYQLAHQGKLNDSKTLHQEIERLLKHPKSERFLKSFVHQWLDMHRLNFFKFDLEQFHTFDQTMKDAVAEEVYQTFACLLREELPIADLLKSDFVVINALLAQHYGIDGVQGEQFRKVKLQKASYRGGLTGMAAIHAMGSNGVESSPVERGVWILRYILNQPPPPAPANVPQLRRNKDKPLTTRQLHAAHQEEAQCAHCHNKIDPIGFGLENFDPVGLWREKEVHGKETYPIDPSGSLKKGPSFKNYHDLRDIFYEEKDAFKRGMLEHMVSYAMGRHAGFSDEQTFQQIEKKMSGQGDSLSSMIHAIVMSDIFQSKN